MENKEAAARDTLTEVARLRQVNEKHLRRPRRYWVMIALFFALWVLSPVLHTALPEPYGYLLPVALVPVVALALLWRKPRDMRIRYTLDEKMVQQVISSVVLPFVGFWALSSALFGFLGWWWVPPVVAVATFFTVYLRFSALDRQWAYSVSHRE